MPLNLEGGDFVAGFVADEFLYLVVVLVASGRAGQFWWNPENRELGNNMEQPCGLQPCDCFHWEDFFQKHKKTMIHSTVNCPPSSLQEPETEANEGTDDAKNGQVLLKEVPDRWMGKCLFFILSSDSIWIYDMIYLHVPIWIEWMSYETQRKNAEHMKHVPTKHIKKGRPVETFEGKTCAYILTRRPSTAVLARHIWDVPSCMLFHSPSAV